MNRRSRAFFALSTDMYNVVYAGEPRRLIESRVDIAGGPWTDGVSVDYSGLSDADFLFLSWGSPRLTGDVLAQLPALRAVFYGAGSIKGVVSDDFWNRDIPISSAYTANAIPVAEYAHAVILLSLKRFWHYQRAFTQARHRPPYAGTPGAFRSIIGLIGLGAIGRLVAAKLHTSDVRILAYDPFVTPEQATALGVNMVDLNALFRESDVISVHAPYLPATDGMVTGSLVSSMKPDATLVNTSRGAIVRELELIDVLRERPDLTAVLDLTHPEPPVPDSPLYDMPNVVLTPHIAGSLGAECKRMGVYMADELSRFLDGQSLQYRITREQCQRMA